MGEKHIGSDGADILTGEGKQLIMRNPYSKNRFIGNKQDRQDMFPYGGICIPEEIQEILLSINIVFYGKGFIARGKQIFSEREGRNKGLGRACFERRAHFPRFPCGAVFMAALREGLFKN